MGEQSVRTIPPSEFTKIMSLPEAVRHDLLEFLGACPMERQQIPNVIHAARQELPSAAPAHAPQMSQG